METKLSRIASFIDTLPMDSKINEPQSALLYTGLELLGGAKINSDGCSNNFTNCGNCYNSSAAECNGATNGGTCRNTTGLCIGGVNDGSCTTVPPVIGPIAPNTSGCGLH